MHPSYSKLPISISYPADIEPFHSFAVPDASLYFVDSFCCMFARGIECPHRTFESTYSSYSMVTSHYRDTLLLYMERWLFLASIFVSKMVS